MECVKVLILQALALLGLKAGLGEKKIEFSCSI